MDPFTGALIGAGVNAGASALSSLFTPKPKKSKTQKMQEMTMEDIMAAINGQGPYAYLFNVDEEAFQRGVADPAMARFRNQTAPQIQQEYISTGQQRGTGLEDTLSRAGVDLHQQINQEYWNAQNKANQNKINMLSGSLNWKDPYDDLGDNWDKLLSGTSGYLESDKFGTDIDKILTSYNKPRSPLDPQQDPNLPKGFAE